jgi:hypothetical protein
VILPVLLSCGAVFECVDKCKPFGKLCRPSIPSSLADRWSVTVAGQGVKVGCTAVQIHSKINIHTLCKYISSIQFKFDQTFNYSIIQLIQSSTMRHGVTMGLCVHLSVFLSAPVGHGGVGCTPCQEVSRAGRTTLITSGGFDTSSIAAGIAWQLHCHRPGQACSCHTNI